MGNSNLFGIFHPENWGRWTHFDGHIFQLGWFVQPPTRFATPNWCSKLDGALEKTRWTDLIWRNRSRIIVHALGYHLVCATVDGGKLAMSIWRHGSLVFVFLRNCSPCFFLFIFNIILPKQKKHKKHHVQNVIHLFGLLSWQHFLKWFRRI